MTNPNGGLLGLSESCRKLAGGYEDPDGNITAATGTSIFDPVLTECCYRWFCPPAGRILDPFAGGSVRGIVAAYLGYKYVGLDLRPEQVAANAAQAARITPDNRPEWVVGDSRLALPAWAAEAGNLGAFDFVFSCPPYFDLEVYSDNPADLSAMDWAGFCAAYRDIIGAAVRLLRRDRFAAFVVGDVRDKRGHYRNLPGETVAAFQAAGAAYYNDAVLLTSVGSLPIRVGKQFESGRKLGKTHQDVLVFVKGDPKKAAEACGTVPDAFEAA